MTASLAAATLLAVGVITGVAPAASAETVSVRSLLDSLIVYPEANDPYDRSYFNLWIDADNNGCDTRAEVLRSESLVPTDGGCPATTGKWYSYYDNTYWTQASDVDIDHMVPLSEAWDSGAWNWTAAQREAYANDLTWPRSLVAVAGNVSHSKGDRDPGQWMPPVASAACQYATDWITVKYRWRLNVDEAERQKLSDVIAYNCPDITTEVPPRVDVPSISLRFDGYVTRIYADLFGRSPDPVGLRTWTQILASGVPVSRVANSITSSTEYRSRLITESYQRFLGRNPEPAGLTYWLGQMFAGQHIEQMEAGFIASDEFYASGGGTPEGWVRRLYRTVLDRTPAPSEVAWWVDAISEGMNRGTVALGFLYSTENLTTVVDGYYVNLLGRHIDPSGNAWWVGLIQAGSRDEEIIAAIVSSTEYLTKV